MPDYQILRIKIIVIIFLCSITLSGCNAARDVLLGPSGSDIPTASSEVDLQLQQVQIGSARDDALKIMTGAWHHGKCEWPNGTVISDVFLYGSKQPEMMQVAVITSENSKGTFVVIRATHAENYMLRQYGFEKCVPQWVLNGNG